MERLLVDLAVICCSRKQNVFKPVAQTFEMVEDLLLDGGFADLLNECDAQTARICELKEELCEGYKGVEESSTNVKEFEKS